jgi:hypothetical protein
MLTRPNYWYVLVDGVELGPIETVELQVLVSSGELRAHDHVRRAGEERWQPAFMLRRMGVSTHVPRRPVSWLKRLHACEPQILTTR